MEQGGEARKKEQGQEGSRRRRRGKEANGVEVEFKGVREESCV